MGEIGKSLYNILKKHYLTIGIDKEEGAVVPVDVMHICFPYSKKFVKQVKQYIEKYSPQVVVVHSTVPVGTTERCGENVFHSPVRGKHPNLERGLKNFMKELGGKDEDIGSFLEGYFRKAEIPVLHRGYSAKHTEFAKIMSTTKYGWDIVFCKEMKKMCDEYGLDFDFCYKRWTKDYNNGYAGLGDDQYIRPVLKPMPGKIGGHCVVQNCDLDKNKITEFILKCNKSYD